MKRLYVALLILLIGVAWLLATRDSSSIQGPVLVASNQATFKKRIEIIFWHSMAGQLGSAVQELVQGFNRSQADFIIKPFYKGEYLESLTSYAAAFRAKKAPDIVQIFEVGSATMMLPQGIVKPVSDLMMEQGYSLATEEFFPVVKATYSSNDKLMAMPFNISIPVVFYNASALKTLGYTEDNFPKSWQGFEKLVIQLRQAGYSCGYTSAYPAWILIESFAALHGLPIIDKSKNQAIYNNEALENHLQRLKKWQKLHYFEYSGRTDEATALFTSGRCPLFSQSSGAFNSLKEAVSFKVGMAPLPLDESISPVRHPNIAGGAALWVTNNLSAEKYQGIASFIAYLAQPEQQVQWHNHTGYIPVGVKGVYQKCLSNAQKSLKLAKLDLNSNEEVLFTSSNIQNQIRVINAEALEAIFAGIKPVNEALDIAVLRANNALRRFSENTKEKGVI